MATKELREPTFDEPIGVIEYQERTERVQRAMREHGYDALVLFSDSIRSSNVRYVVPFWPLDALTELSWAVVILPAEGEPRLFVHYMNILWAREASWFGAQTLDELPAALVELRSKVKAGNGKVGTAGDAFMPAPLRTTIMGCIGLSGITVEPAEHVMARLKAVKTPAEIELLRRAGALCAVGLDAIREAVTRPGRKSERSVQLEATAAIIEAGGDRPTFDIQIQSGQHSAMNNVRTTNREILPGDSLLLEMGAMYQGYVTDIARGAVYGEPKDLRQVEIIEVAAQAVEAGIAALRPGIKAGDLHEVVQGHVRDAGYFQYVDEYGTGHGIGTDVEEEEPWVREGAEFILEENMAFAFKSSMFVPGVAGVRVEENVLITVDGCEVYTPYDRVLLWGAA